MRAKLKLSYIIYALLILSNLIFIHNTSALSYQSDINVSFTFNPTISVSISNDLAIPSLTPGTTSDSNEINVNVSTNNVYGYNLYATVGNSTYNNTNLTNTNNNIAYIFTTISPTANLSSLDTDNTWGYSYSLDNGSNWSNYNGLSIYTTDNPTRLTKNTGPSEDTLNFKIAAKAGNTQPSGTYNNVINFYAVTKPSPTTLADAYASEGKELYHGYYKMQDMTHTICEETEDIGSQLQVIDIRDDKVYWISKLADNNCWMTQNLDLDLISDPQAENYVALTSENTDLTDATSAAYQDGYTINGGGLITWVPTNTTITGVKSGNYFTFDNWVDDLNRPYSADVGNSYIGNSNNGHNLSGNYYNWTAAIASNNSDQIISAGNINNSICSKGWRLPNILHNNMFSNLLTIAYGINRYNVDDIMNTPLYYIKSGLVSNGSVGEAGFGIYWSSSSVNASQSRRFVFGNNYINTGGNYADRGSGFSVRCVAK